MAVVVHRGSGGYGLARVAQAGEDADEEGGVGERAGEAHGGRGLREPLAVHGDGEQQARERGDMQHAMHRERTFRG